MQVQSDSVPLLSSHVRPLYLDDPDKVEHQTTVTDTGTALIKKNQYHWIQLAETIFHPQGGGQLSDKGTINGIKVDFVHKEVIGNDKNCFEIKHCFSQPVPIDRGQVVALKIDQDFRRTNSRWHTAAHVVGHLVEKMYPQLEAVTGNCFPGEAFMKFTSRNNEYVNEQTIQGQFQTLFEKFLSENPPMQIVIDEGMRKLKIGNYTPVHCAGTHTHNVREIGRISLLSCKITRKERTISIKYKVEQ